MGTYVGVDWAAGDWIAFALDDAESAGDGWAVGTHPAMLNVWHEYREAERILVDVPIGLPETEVRACDKQARAELGGRTSSVFATPCRAAVEAETYDEASALNEAALGGGISAQAWGIVPRIREVDVLLAEHGDADGTIRESHPELCFRRLDEEGRIVASKHDAAGLAQRRDVLAAVDDELGDVYEAIVDEYVDVDPAFKRPISRNARDDVLDAMVLALTAREAGDEPATVPESPPKDAAGRRMEMVCPDR
jgi:predicted RNase H-like nuclease